MTMAITPVVYDLLERVVASLSINKIKEFVTLTPAKVFDFVLLETPIRPMYVIETGTAQV